MKKLLALTILAIAPAFAGTTYQPIAVGSSCMVKPLGADRVINSSFISNIRSGQFFDHVGVFWRTKVPYFGVQISGPSLWLEIRTKDQVEAVAVADDLLTKIKACQK